MANGNGMTSGRAEQPEEVDPGKQGNLLRLVTARSALSAVGGAAAVWLSARRLRSHRLLS